MISIKTGIFNLKKLAATVDWQLLAFLILFLNVKTGVKLVAIILIYLLRFDFNLGFRFKKSRLPLFYPIAIGIAILNWAMFSNKTGLNYNIVFCLGISFWLLCILAIHQVKLMVERDDPEKIHQTILVFFIINAAVSLLILLNIIHEIHAINPYRYQGNYQKYFIGTGDYIKGLTFDVSTTNSVLNAFGVVYFLVRRNMLMVLLCMAIMLLTGSNAINLLLTVVMVLLFIFKSSKDQKSIIVVCMVFLSVFIFKISPQNDEYIYKTYYKIRYKALPPNPVINLHPTPITQKPDSILSADERKEKRASLYLDSVRFSILAQDSKGLPPTIIKPDIPVPSIHTPPFQNRTDTNAERKRLIDFVNNNKSKLPQASLTQVEFTIPGKAIAMKQTLAYLHRNPAQILTGSGMGNFSSKLAFKATGLGVAGSFPARYSYISASFLTNHLDLYLDYFSRSAGWHSLINSPNSVYDQLLSEYGIIGILAFCIFYLGYFLSHYKKLTYGIPLLVLISGVFLLDYWFEQLSIIVFFELLMLLNIKENTPKTLTNGNT